MSDPFGQRLALALRGLAHAFAAGDQVAPCAVLWPDPERAWEAVIPQLRKLLPELSTFGGYDPQAGSGPALWLRCIEARVVDGAPPAGTVPVFYLPGVSKEQLRAVEDCPRELAAVIELQFRGTVWLHVNGKEWTPYGFLVSQHGGLNLDVPRDQATLDALAGALPQLMDEPVSQLEGRRLDAEFFNALVVPDASGLLLRWLSDPEGFRQRQSAAEWKAFCNQCKTDFSFDPVKDGALKAAQLLADRGNQWAKVWRRFAESPGNYPGIVEWLRRAAPKEPSMFDTAEVWPTVNEGEERQLRRALEALADRPPDEVVRRVRELEAQHADRRRHPWQKLGLSPLATALERLADLCARCATPPGAPDATAFAAAYAAEAWQTDAAALATMAACTDPEQAAVVLAAMRAAYLPWLEATARQLQQMLAGATPAKRLPAIEPAPGRVVVFADGLRLDVARLLADRLATDRLTVSLDWDWSTVPAVTASAKPAVSPVAGDLEGGEAEDEFAVRLAATGQRLTQDRFLAALRERRWQCLGPAETGDTAGSAWAECGTLDKRGHNDGWKLARGIEEELRDLTSRIAGLVRAGWAEVMVVTDHGWLLLPGGLPKVELKQFLAEHRWGRCAALRAAARPETQVLPWSWNPEVAIASPAGVGCYRASIEYSHGGISLQEMVTPRLVVTAAAAPAGAARLAEARWTGARCRVVVSGECADLWVDVRTRLADSDTSLLTDRQARAVPADGKVTVFLEDDADIGRKAQVVLLDDVGQVIDSLPTNMGG